MPQNSAVRVTFPLRHLRPGSCRLLSKGQNNAAVNVGFGFGTEYSQHLPSPMPRLVFALSRSNYSAVLISSTIYYENVQAYRDSEKVYGGRLHHRHLGPTTDAPLWLPSGLWSVHSSPHLPFALAHYFDKFRVQC